MRKVRITIREPSPGRRFWLFTTSSDLNDWIDLCYEDPTAGTACLPEGASEVVLKPEGVIEAEWWGFESRVESPWTWRSLNFIRLVEARPSFNASGQVVTIHAGWVIDTIMPMRQYQDENILVEETNEDDSIFDLDELFREKGIEM